ncbi:MAG TPA: alpha-galactosidase [Gemmatimonadales bacterium]|nr:alpha-galactosidase [Gemmatimonadales bacterium]
MDRRTFILLTGAVSAPLLRTRRSLPPPAGRLRFELDGQRQWSLFYQGSPESVPVIRNAGIGAWIADRFISLSELEYSTLGSRRPPGGESLIVRGRSSAVGVVLEAEFFCTTDTAPPQASISVRVYPDRTLPTIGGVRFFQVAASDILPFQAAETAPLWALVDGATSSSAVTLVQLSDQDQMPRLESRGAVGLTRQGRGLALGFQAEDPGTGRVQLASDGLDVASEWMPPRPLRPEGDASLLRLTYDAGGDGLTALGALFRPQSIIDRERMDAVPVPAGWASRSELGRGVSEDTFLTQVERCASQFDLRSFRFVELDQGYERAVGDWECNAKFPHGHRWLTDQVRARGLLPGLWIAPCVVSERSGIPVAQPEWLLKDADGADPIVGDTREDWGGKLFALDPAHPSVQEWLRSLARRARQEWGYEYLKLDLLAWAVGDTETSTGPATAHYGGLTHAEAYQRALDALRDGAGADTLLLGAGAPLEHSVGQVDGMQIGPSVDAAWTSIAPAAPNIARRSFYNRGAWINDPDCVVVREPLTLDEARLWASTVAVSAGVTFCSDDLTRLPAERLELLQRILPPATRIARVLEGGATGDSRPTLWIVEGSPGWWTVLLANWGDAAETRSVPAASLGLTGKRFTAYDVWGAAPLNDITDRLGGTIPGHGALVVGMRRALGRPQVVGSNRHVVQGMHDVADERWDATARVLTARATNLDGRAYAVTVSVPATLRATTCKSEVACAVSTLSSGHTRLEWPAGTQREFSWGLSFRSQPAARGPRHP